MFYWEMWRIIPSFISIILPCLTACLQYNQYQFPVISNIHPRILSEGEFLKHVVVNCYIIHHINNQSWHMEWCELIYSYLATSFHIIKLVFTMWISCRAKENFICSFLDVCRFSLPVSTLMDLASGYKIQVRVFGKINRFFCCSFPCTVPMLDTIILWESIHPKNAELN